MEKVVFVLSCLLVITFLEVWRLRYENSKLKKECSKNKEQYSAVGGDIVSRNAEKRVEPHKTSPRIPGIGMQIEE